MNKSTIRYALYRIKNNDPVAEYKELYDGISTILPKSESWETFSTNWDILLDGNQIVIISPEVDFDFIHETCLEKSIHVKKGIDFEPTPRQKNVIQIVELNMLDNMSWETYNKTWSVELDRGLKRISTKLFKTNINIVTEEMIRNSIKSDGSAMTALPILPEYETSMIPMSEEEIAKFKALSKKQV